MYMFGFISNFTNIIMILGSHNSAEEISICFLLHMYNTRNIFGKHLELFEYFHEPVY